MGTNLSTSMMNSLSLSVLLLCTAAASSVASSLDEFTELSAVSKCPGEGPRYGDYKCNHDQTHRVCARLKDAKGAKKQWGSGDFWAITQQPDWSASVRQDPKNPGGDWCICMWATAKLIKEVGCENVHLDCGATDVAFVMGKYTDGGHDLEPAKNCLATKCS